MADKPEVLPPEPWREEAYAANERLKALRKVYAAAQERNPFEPQERLDEGRGDESA